ncbi:hypothetical protein HRI_004743700 [Hibiscus trionum]|uniref:Reverse transcriptase domain-containing protein n=1 Tax=Hibiscus trionum TaxID=183268 RepID=A0A9W7JA14_HIBTR|nr:hypothetical protein HRI_004743700 [Hibiscus trionum]
MLDASANGTLLDKSPEEAFDIIDRVANNNYQFSTTRLGTGRRTQVTRDSEADDSVAIQLATITNMLKNLQRPNEVKEVKSTTSCLRCDGNHHLSECPDNQESANYVGNYNRNNNPYSNTYNPGWR